MKEYVNGIERFCVECNEKIKIGEKMVYRPKKVALSNGAVIDLKAMCLKCRDKWLRQKGR